MEISGLPPAQKASAAAANAATRSSFASLGLEFDQGNAQYDPRDLAPGDLGIPNIAQPTIPALDDPISIASPEVPPQSPIPGIASPDYSDQPAQGELSGIDIPVQTPTNVEPSPSTEPPASGSGSGWEPADATSEVPAQSGDDMQDLRDEFTLRFDAIDQKLNDILSKLEEIGHL